MALWDLKPFSRFCYLALWHLPITWTPKFGSLSSGVKKKEGVYRFPPAAENLSNRPLVVKVWAHLCTGYGTTDIWQYPFSLHLHAMKSNDGYFVFEISANGCKGAHQTPLWGFVCSRSTPSFFEGDTEFPPTKRGSYVCLFPKYCGVVIDDAPTKKMHKIERMGKFLEN